MKNIIKFLSLVLVFAFAFSINNVDAQSRRKKDRVDEYFDDQGSILQRVWFGADASFNFIPFRQGNYIRYGLSPMAGLKLSEVFSVGPRIEFSVLNGRISNNFRIPDFEFKFNTVTIGAGIFARAKIGRTYFLHAEFARISEAQPVVDNSFAPRYDSEGQFIIDRRADNSFFIGGGYNNQISETFGIQVTVLFDTLVDRDLWEFGLPITTRLGLNYKF